MKTLELEQSIIGGLILFPEEITPLAAIISPEDFNAPKLREAYRTICDTNQADPVIIAQQSGVSVVEVSEWMDCGGSRAHLKKECQTLRDHAKTRDLHTIARKILQGGEPDDVLAMIETSVRDITTRAQTDTKIIRDVLKQTAKDLEHRYRNQGQTFGMSTGFPELDTITTGIHPGELWIVAGRPGMGKSAYGANVIEAAARSGQPGIFFSTEMKAGQVAERMLSGAGRVKLSRIRSGNIQDADWKRISHGMQDLAGLPIHIDECPGLTLGKIKAVARQQKRTNGLGIIVVDYLQRMDIPGDNRSRAVGEVSRALKDLAMELDIAIILLSQLNRSLESRADKRPLMSDLRDSGEIEQDADVILFPYREAVYCADCKQGTPGHDSASHQAKAELILEKQRNGEAPVTIPVAWMREFVRFTGMG